MMNSEKNETKSVLSPISRLFVLTAIAFGTLSAFGNLFGGTARSIAQAAPVTMQALTSTELKAKFKSKGVKVTVVNLWATWCAPCKTELPDFLKIKKDYASKGLQLILVSADSADELKDAALFLDQIGVDFPTFRLGEDPEPFVKAVEPNWSATLPTTLVFDAEGRKVKTWVGAIDAKTLRTEIDKVLKGGGKASKTGLSAPVIDSGRKISSY